MVCFGGSALFYKIIKKIENKKGKENKISGDEDFNEINRENYFLEIDFTFEVGDRTAKTFVIIKNDFYGNWDILKDQTIIYLTSYYIADRSTKKGTPSFMSLTKDGFRNLISYIFQKKN